jgi:cobalt-zinc-cadmium efflux system outer membrane protein
MNISGNGRDALMPMITMSIPIFRKKYNAAIEESQLLQKSVQYQIEGTENQLITRYETSLFEADKSIQLDYLYSLQSQKTEQALNLLYTDYSNSGKDFEEVLRMQQQLLKYEMAQATVRTQFHIALAQLAYITAKSE